MMMNPATQGWAGAVPTGVIASTSHVGLKVNLKIPPNLGGFCDALHKKTLCVPLLLSGTCNLENKGFLLVCLFVLSKQEGLK